MPLNSPHISQARQTHRLRNTGILVAILAFSSIFAVRLFAQNNETIGTLTNATAVSTDVIKMTEMYNRSRSFTGRAAAKHRSMLGFEMAGTLKSINVDDGDTFKKFDILARLDTSRLEAKLNELEARRAELAANQNLAAKTYQRIKKVNERGHTSAQFLDEAYNNFITSKARSQGHDATIRGLEIDLEKSRIIAPFDGVVTARFVDEGTIVSGGLPVFDVIEGGKIQAKIGVSPTVAKHINSKTNFTLRNGQRQPIEGTFINSVASIRGQTRTMLATFDITSNVSDGEIITLVINDPIEIKGAWVPIRALASDVRGLWRLYKVVDGKHGPEVRFENVQLLHTTGDMAYVSGSFNNDDTIIREGVDKLAKGQRVNPIPYDPAAR